jgi:hypothetical protein
MRAILVAIACLCSVALPGAQSFRVDDYAGADDRETINRAFAAMRGVAGAKRLVFARRTYRVTAADTDTFAPVLDLSQVADLVVDGDGAVIEATGMLGARKGYLLACRSFRDVAIRDLRITFAPRPSVQGRILAVDQRAGIVEVELEAGRDGIGALQSHATAELWCRTGQVASPHLPKPHSPSWLRVAAADGGVWREPLGERCWRLRCGGFDTTATIGGRHAWQVGDPLVIWQRGAQDALAAWDGRDLRLSRVVIDSALHFAIKARGVDGVEIAGCRIEPPSGGMISGSADGIDIQQSRRIVVRDCRIVANGDDAISLLNHGHGFNGERHEGRFDQPWPDTNEDVLLVDNHIEGGNRNGILALATRCEIRGNTLRDLRQYGVKCTGDDAVIADNRFERVGSFTAFRHITDELDTGIVCSDEWTQRRWTVSGNTFIDWYHMPAILLKSVEGAVVSGNRFVSAPARIEDLRPNNAYLSAPTAICLTSGVFRGRTLDSSGIRLSGNRLAASGVEGLVVNGSHTWSGERPHGR